MNLTGPASFQGPSPPGMPNSMPPAMASYIRVRLELPPTTISDVATSMYSAKNALASGMPARMP